MNTPKKKAARVQLVKDAEELSPVALVINAARRAKGLEGVGPMVAGVHIKTKPTEKPHAKHSPSSLKNKEICPGFMGRDSESVASAEGTLLHKYMELWGRGARGHKFTAAENAEWKSLKDAHTTEQDETLSVLVSVMCAKFVEYRYGTTLFEYEFDLTMLNLPGCEHGTADVVLVGHDRVCIVDYKFGKVEVDTPEDNVQFFAYALGAFHKYPNVREVDVLCLQPRCDVKGEATFTRDQMPGMALRLKVIVERAEVVDAATLTGAIEIVDGFPFDAPKLNPQTSLCEYCSNVGICPAVARFTLIATPDLDLPAKLDPVESKDDSSGLGALASWSKIMEAAAKNLLARLVTLAGEGHEIDGFFLINASGKKALIDPLGLAKELQKKFKLTPEQLLTCATLSTEKIEELIAKGAPTGKKEAAKENVRKLMSDGGYFSTSPGYSYLKKASK